MQSASIHRRLVLTATAATLGGAFAPGVSAAAETIWFGEYSTAKQRNGTDIRLAMYRKRLGAPQPGEAPRPVLFMVHGSSTSARSSFDLAVPGRADYSMMDVFARYGFDVWTMDHEGYGRSVAHRRQFRHRQRCRGPESGDGGGRARNRARRGAISSANRPARCARRRSPSRRRSMPAALYWRRIPTPAKARRRWQSAPSRWSITAPTTPGCATAR